MTRIDFFGLDWEFVGWTIYRANKKGSLLWYLNNTTTIYALCVKDKNEGKGCASDKEEDTPKEYEEVRALTWSTRPTCLANPTCFDGFGDASGVKGALMDLADAHSYAKKCGSMNGYQCFLSTKMQEDGQKFCDTLFPE